MRPATVMVPDPLWRASEISEGAKLLWCVLSCTSSHQACASYADLRRASGFHQPSLTKHLSELTASQWLLVVRQGLRQVQFQLQGQELEPYLQIPSDLLGARTLPVRAKWVWGVINRLGRSLTYAELHTETGFSMNSLTPYVRALMAQGWLAGGPTWQGRRLQLPSQTLNPAALRRQAEIEELERGLAAARHQPGYSAGQYLLSRMIRLLFPDLDILENVELTGLDNIETGGRLQYDLLIPAKRLAIEFHGTQHFRPTERFPSPELFQAQRKRDLIKLGLSQEREIDLLVLTAKHLHFERLIPALAPWLSPQPVLDELWHLYEFLATKASHYRRMTLRGESRGRLAPPKALNPGVTSIQA